MSTDDGLTEAVQRVMAEMTRHTGSGHFRSCPCGWSEHGMPATYAQHVATLVARAAREDVADHTRQAQADALAETALDVRTGRWPDESLAAWLDLRAAAIREGREP